MSVRTGTLAFVVASLAVLGVLLQVSLAAPTSLWVAMTAISVACTILGMLLYVGLVHPRRVWFRAPREGVREPSAAAPRWPDSPRTIEPEQLSDPCAAPRSEQLTEKTGNEARHHLQETELRGVNHLAVVGRLTAEMAHEFGTPLGVILARAGMIVADDVSLVEAQRDAEAIIVQVRRMTELCRTVLDYARPQPAADGLERVDLVCTVQQTLKLLALEARKRKSKLELEGQHAPMFVLGQGSKLVQVLTNLVVNAMESMPGGGEIKLRVERRHTTAMEQENGVLAEYACVHVQDQGTGIAPSQLPHVFEAFFTSKQAEGGSGLGLTISQRIAKEYGGWLTVVSSDGHGSCFSLYLPLHQAV